MANNNGNHGNPNPNPNPGNGTPETNPNPNPETPEKKPWYKRLADRTKVFMDTHPKIKRAGKIVGGLALVGGAGFGGYKLGQKDAPVHEVTKYVYMDKDEAEEPAAEVTTDDPSVEEILDKPE